MWGVSVAKGEGVGGVVVPAQWISNFLNQQFPKLESVIECVLR